MESDYQNAPFSKPSAPSAPSAKAGFKPFLIPAAILGVAALIVLYKITSQPPQMSLPPAEVTLTAARAEIISTTMTFIGLVEAEKQVEIKPRVKGFLLSKSFEEGKAVRQGQPLFQIEPDEYQIALAAAQADEISAQAELVRSQADFNRISDLYRKGSSTKSDYDDRKAAFDSARGKVLLAQSKVKQAELNLSYTSIKAPFDGQVSDSDFYEGSLIDPNANQTLTTVVSVDPIWVTFGISERLITQLKEINLSDKPAKVNTKLKIGGKFPYPFSGQLVFIDPIVDRNTDTVKVKASFRNPDNLLIPNQMVTVEVETVANEASVLLPQKAVITEADGGRCVMVVDENGLAAKLPVTVGGEHGQDYIITSGLKAGDAVISSGLVFMGGPLPPGLPVRVKDGSPAPDGRPDAGIAPAPSEAPAGRKPDAFGAGGGASDGRQAPEPAGSEAAR